ncbi:MAG: SpoIIE family protein phosphatase [Candidatus Cloacimonetes bacterium]|nr:SpoIIE family protein phosphatase [Candidatus Cloacimonadota bacterium]
MKHELIIDCGNRLPHEVSRLLITSGYNAVLLNADPSDDSTGKLLLRVVNSGENPAIYKKPVFIPVRDSLDKELPPPEWTGEYRDSSHAVTIPVGLDMAIELADCSERITDFEKQAGVLNHLDQSEGFQLIDNLIISNSHTKYSPNHFQRNIQLSKTKYMIARARIDADVVTTLMIKYATHIMLNKLLPLYEPDGPGRILSMLNSMIVNQFEGSYVHIVLGILNIENDTFEYSGAGSFPFYLMETCSGKTDRIACSHTVPIGTEPHYPYCMKESTLYDVDPYHIRLVVTHDAHEPDSKSKADFLNDSLLIHDPKMVSGLMFPQWLVDKLNREKETLLPDSLHLSTIQAVKQNESELSKTEWEESLLFAIDSRKPNISLVGREGESFIRNRTQCDSLGYKVELILNEFLNNITMFGVESSIHSVILVYLKILQDGVEIRFYDEGCEWDFPPDYQRDTGLDARNQMFRDRGRGMLMIGRIASNSSRRRMRNINETIFYINCNLEKKDTDNG